MIRAGGLPVEYSGGYAFTEVNGTKLSPCVWQDRQSRARVRSSQDMVKLRGSEANQLRGTF